ncbi:hypothetical protein SN4111_14770 [Ligilactobacillus agilis]|nr:hypothetical protein [Ligilactobacillus agilis]GET15215.1 hypothetical protein SN4111_14770 [Ligilactobacillus agilis]
MKYWGVFFCGLALAQDNFFACYGLLILGLGLIALKVMMEPWPGPDEKEE